jgi:hypothetical protein
MDKDCIDTLIALGTDPSSIRRIQDLAAKEMQRAGLGYTLHNACAATLSEFLNVAGINVPITLGAGRLASRIENDRGWIRKGVGEQRAGDVAVTFDRTNPSGADHIFLVVERIDADEMIIADNQAKTRHARFASGHGKTPVEYFLRAPNDQLAMTTNAEMALNMDFYPDVDEDSNDLVEPFKDDGNPA